MRAARDGRADALSLSLSILAIRNDPNTGVVMWTGNRDQVWPTKPLPPNNTTVLPYAGCENGIIAANMYVSKHRACIPKLTHCFYRVIPALYILKSPCLWNLVRCPLSRRCFSQFAYPSSVGPRQSRWMDRPHHFRRHRDVQSSCSCSGRSG